MKRWVLTALQPRALQRPSMLSTADCCCQQRRLPAPAPLACAANRPMIVHQIEVGAGQRAAGRRRGAGAWSSPRLAAHRRRSRPPVPPPASISPRPGSPLFLTLQALKAAGVDEVVLAINYRPQARLLGEERGEERQLVWGRSRRAVCQG